MPKRYVPGKGPREAKIAIVGEQPGKQELIHCIPFIGPAGEELDKCLHTAGIVRSECYITNVVKDLDNPLKHYIDIPSSSSARVKVSLEGNKYLEELKKELEYVSPNVVIAAGNVALYALTERRGITKWRGSVVPSSLVDGLKVVPCLHPSTILPKPPQHMGQYLNKHLIAYDMKKALEESHTQELMAPQPLIHTEPKFFECVEWLAQIQYHGRNGCMVDFDIEIVNEELFCFAFATRPDEAFVIPLVKGGDYWTIEQEAEILLLTAKILEDPLIPIRGQNLAFDVSFMHARYGMVTNGEIHDTMIAQKITMPDYPAGLDFIASMHTSFPYYKAEGKKYIKLGGDIQNFWNYNGRDALSTCIAHPKQVQDLERQENVATYDRQRRLIPILVYMQNKGIRVDVQGMSDGRKDTEILVKQKEEELWSLVGYQINYNSSAQMQRYFYDEKGIPPYKKKNSKGGYSITCDADALKRIVRGTVQRPGLKEAKLVMELRSLSTKTLGTYLSLDKIDLDGRYRSAYNPVGARTGRLSSSENIFGTGCLLPEAEVLTSEGWIALKNLQEGVEVAQWNPSSQITWTIPKIVSHKNQSRVMIKASSSVHKNFYTPDHRIPKLTKRGKLHILKAYEASIQSNWFLPLSGKSLLGSGISLSPALIAATQADGSIEGNGIRFSFCKERKIERFICLMNYLKISYNEQKAPPGYRKFYIPVSHGAPYAKLLGTPKLLGSWILEMTSSQLNEFVEEAAYWDGHVRNNSFIYYTALKENAEWMATAAHLAGKSATINKIVNNPKTDRKGVLFSVNIKPRNRAYMSSDMFTTVDYEGDVYCLTTESSFFLCRYDDTICVTGNSNQQNWPHSLLKYMLADVGYIAYSIDLSQIENRIVAYIGRIFEMIEAFEAGYDLHRLTAALIFNKHPDDITTEDGTCDIGDGTHSERFWGKKSNHSLNYDIGYKEFALTNEVTEKEAKDLIESYHHAYPGVRGSFHEMVQSQLAKDRTLTNLFGRRRLFLDKWGRKLFKEAYAQIPQSTTADKINEQGLEHIYYNQQWYAPVEILRQVHDDVGFQIPLSAGFIYHAESLLRLKKSLETPLEWHGREFIVPADITMGLSFTKEEGHCLELKSHKIPDDPESLAKILEEAYNDILKPTQR